jgi:hypothetical protein
MRYASSNPPVRNRINAMNSRLQTIDGSVRLMVDGGHAENVVTDLEGVLRKPDGTLDKKKNPDLSHLSDGLGYYIAQKFPVSDGERVTSKELVL